MKIIYGQYIGVDADILTGKPIIKGTRVPVDIILKKMSQNISIDDILSDYPNLRREHIQEAIAYAHSLISNEEIYSLTK